MQNRCHIIRGLLAARQRRGVRYRCTALEPTPASPKPPSFLSAPITKAAKAARRRALVLVDKSPLPDQIFECASALGTVGLSRGITVSLPPLGKFIIIALMFLGRLGPLVLGMAFFERRPPAAQTITKEGVAI